MNNFLWGGSFMHNYEGKTGNMHPIQKCSMRTGGAHKTSKTKLCNLTENLLRAKRARKF